MSCASEEAKFCLKVMINKEETKVLFAEVDNDFADVLLSFLTLPLGTIVRLLKKHYGDNSPCFGSLNTLYNTVADLDTVHFWTDTGKHMLLNPRSSFEAECRNMKINIDDTEPKKYYTCQSTGCLRWHLSMYYSTSRCSRCGKEMNKEVVLRTFDCDGAFTVKTSSFLIGDDLRMVPIVAGSINQTLSILCIADTDGAKQTTVTVGLNEIMDLLKGWLFSPTPLTDLILHKTHIDSAINTAIFEPRIDLPDQTEKVATPSSSKKKMKLKVMVQKSADKFLFAHAEDDFVAFIFSFLTIPLGGVEFLLGNNTSLKNIDNLYRSIANLRGDAANCPKYLKYLYNRNSILNPLLPPMFLSNKQLFNLSQQDNPERHYWTDEKTGNYKEHYSNMGSSSYEIGKVYYMDPKGQGSYVKGPKVYMVTDDLTVLPWSMLSTLSVLNSMNIPLSDVQEVELEVGLKEGLSILKASLSSCCALSNALGPMLMKQPKQERQI